MIVSINYRLKLLRVMNSIRRFKELLLLIKLVGFNRKFKI